MSYAELSTKDGELYVVCVDRKDPDEIHHVEQGWESFSGCYWFGIEEVDPDTHEPRAGTGYWFGFVQAQYSELGYFTEDQLEPLMADGRVWPIREEDLPHAGRR